MRVHVLQLQRSEGTPPLPALDPGWTRLASDGLAVVDPVRGVDKDIARRMVAAGRLGVLAGWRLLSDAPAVDKCVITSLDQVANVLGHLDQAEAQVRSGERIRAVAEAHEVIPPRSASVSHGFPRLAAALDALDADWDVLFLAATAFSAFDHHTTTDVAVDAGVHARIARARFAAGSGCVLVSLGGAKKLVPLLGHADTPFDRVVGLGAHQGSLRVYTADFPVLGGREPFVAPARKRPARASPSVGSETIVFRQPDGLAVFFGPLNVVPLWATAAFVFCAVAVVALSIALAVVGSARAREGNRTHHGHGARGR